jgi:hypothetical protein
MASIRIPTPVAAASRPAVSLVSLYLLRAAYLLLIVGLGTSVWPALLRHEPWALTLSPWNGVGTSLIAALPVLALLGLRYPLKMLPLLFFEITWKVIWLAAVALPLWTSHRPIADDVQQTIAACVMVVVFPFLMPWRFIFRTFAREPGDRWT